MDLNYRLTCLPDDILARKESTKWHDYPKDVLPMHVAEMDFEIATPIKQTLSRMILESDTGYLGAAPDLIASIVWNAKQMWNWDLDAKQVYVVPDVAVGMIEVARLFIKPGDKILLNSPVYHNFTNWINELKCERIDAPLTKEDLKYSLDLELIEQKYKEGVKVHFLCHPHNPVGAIFTSEQLHGLAELASQYKVIILSDEIHAPLVFNRNEFTPFLKVSETAREVGVTISSASKSWNLAGLKCAHIITASESMHVKMQNLPTTLYYRAALLGAVASTIALRELNWLEAALCTIKKNHDYFESLLLKLLPLAKYIKPEFGYLAWVDLSAYNLGNSPSEFLLEKAKVSTNGGATFGENSSNFIRINLGTSEERIFEAMQRICNAINANS